ncbi:PspC domain-containing protein [Corynebacterium glutamicum]|uniref:PspC domain-containing protein n=1 Tax=Corynebacterium glutamicum TaxID=1718 RepID=UPI00211AAB36|nr:PspC domain-containing protein [Corynebacterium glutamicum]
MDKVKFFRSRDNKNIADVCAGVAKYYDLDADTVRYWYVLLISLVFRCSRFI